MLLNAWLRATVEPIFSQMAQVDVRYLFWMLLLVVWEMPLATSVATLFLGEAVFQERPAPGASPATSSGRSATDLLSGVFAGPLPAADRHDVPSLFAPALSERSDSFGAKPLASASAGRAYDPRRSRALHGGGSGEFFARWLASAAFVRHAVHRSLEHDANADAPVVERTVAQQFGFHVLLSLDALDRRRLLYGRAVSRLS